MKNVYVVTILLLSIFASGCINIDDDRIIYPEDTYNIIYGNVALAPTWQNLQIAMDSAGNEIIFLPEGTIWTEGILYPQAWNRIFGRGQDKSWIKSNSNTPENGGSYFTMFYSDEDADNMEFAYFSTDMNQKGSNTFNFYGSDNHIHHINIYRSGFNGIAMWGEGQRYQFNDINCYDGKTAEIGEPSLGCHGFAFGILRNSTTYNLNVYGWSSAFDYHAENTDAWNLYAEDITGLTMKVIPKEDGTETISPNNNTFINIELHSKPGYDPDGLKIFNNEWSYFENIRCDRFYVHDGFNDHNNTFKNIQVTDKYGDHVFGVSINGNDHTVDGIYVENSESIGFTVFGNNIDVKNVHVKNIEGYNHIRGKNIVYDNCIFENSTGSVQNLIVSPYGWESDNVIIKNCVVKNGNSNGIDIGLVTDLQIIDTEVINCYNAIRLTDSASNYITIKDNYFCDNIRNEVVDNTPEITTKTIENNRVCE